MLVGACISKKISMCYVWRLWCWKHQMLFWRKWFLLQCYISHLFCLLNPNREGSQGTQRQRKKRGDGRGRHKAMSPLCLCGCRWAGLRGYGEGILQGSSLLWMGQLFSDHSCVPVPTEQPGSAKRRTDAATLQSTTWKSLVLRGVSLRGDQQAPG